MIQHVIVILGVILVFSQQKQCLLSEPMKWFSHQISSRQMFLNTKIGFPMIVDAQDRFVSKSIMQSGYWQGGMLYLLSKIVKQGDSIINLGSQTGLQVLYMGKVVGPNGKIYIFEPYSISYRIVRKNVYLNDLEDIVTTFNIGASNANQIGKLKVYIENTGASEVWERKPFKNINFTNNKDQTGQIQDVILSSVDQVLPNDTLLDFAFIDVQFMEIQALDGMKQTIKRSSNLIIVTEWKYGINPNRNDTLGQDIINFLLTDLGYKGYSLAFTSDCTMPRFILFPNYNSYLMKKQMNIIFIPKGKQLPKD